MTNTQAAAEVTKKAIAAQKLPNAAAKAAAYTALAQYCAANELPGKAQQYRRLAHNFSTPAPVCSIFTHPGRYCQKDFD